MDNDRPHWPSRPWRPFAAAAFSVLVFAGCVRLWQLHAALLPREYLCDYVRLQFQDVPLWKTYDVILNGSTPALPTDSGVFTPVKRQDAALWKTYKVADRDGFRDWLQTNIYDGQPLWRVLLWPLIAAGLVFVPLMIWAVRAQQEANREARHGRLIRGPRLVSHRQWNRRCPFRNRGLYIDTK